MCAQATAICQLIGLAFIMVLAVTLPGCLPEEFEPSAPPVVSFAIGNEYVYYEAELSGLAFTDWWGRETVTHSTLIGTQTWYRFDTSVLRRADATRVYSIRNGSESVEFDFTAAVGDTVIFDGERVVVKNIWTDAVFGERQRVFELSNEGISDGSVSTFRYVTRFGRLSSFTRSSNSSSQSLLVAAIIEGKLYGDTTFLSK